MDLNEEEKKIIEELAELFKDYPAEPFKLTATAACMINDAQAYVELLKRDDI